MIKLQKQCILKNLIVFYSLEERYHEQSIKSIALENSASKFFPVGNLVENQLFKKSNGNWSKLIKYKTGLIATLGDKISFLIHIYFFNHLASHLDNFLTVLLNFSKESKSTPKIDFKLLKNTLNTILKNDSHKNLYFKENYEILKADYYFQMRLFIFSFQILSRVFLFPNPKKEEKIITISFGNMFRFLQILTYRLNELYFPKPKKGIDLKLKELEFLDNSDIRSRMFGCQDIVLEKTDKFLKNYFSDMQNRHFCKKIFRKRQFFNLLLNYKKIDLEGQYNFQKSDIKQKLLSFEIFRSRTSLLLPNKSILCSLKSNIDLLAYLIPNN